VEREIVSRSVEETIELGRKLGEGLKGGEVLALRGTLGTGKTHLIKGVALGLGASEREGVRSPTFTLINEYKGRLPLYHVDAYRLKEEKELEALGFDEICTSEAVVAVEWAERVESLIKPYQPINIYLEHRGENERLIRIENR